MTATDALLAALVSPKWPLITLAGIALASVVAWKWGRAT